MTRLGVGSGGGELSQLLPLLQIGILNKIIHSSEKHDSVCSVLNVEKIYEGHHVKYKILYFVSYNMLCPDCESRLYI